MDVGGSADTERGVRHALIRLFVEVKGCPEEQAEKHVMGDMKKVKLGSYCKIFRHINEDGA